MDVDESRGAAAMHRAVRVLGYMIGHDPLDEFDIARGLGASAGDVRETLVSLEHGGLVERASGRGTRSRMPVSGRWTALPPSSLLNVLLVTRQPRPVPPGLPVRVPDEVRRGTEPVGNAAPIDIVSGEEQVRNLLRGLRVTAVHELLYLVKGAFPPDTALPGPRWGTVDPAVDPVTVRVVHETAARPVLHPGARQASTVPNGLMVVDRNIAVLPTSGWVGEEIGDVLVVHVPAIVDALVALFERVWAEAAEATG